MSDKAAVNIESIKSIYTRLLDYLDRGVAGDEWACCWAMESLRTRYPEAIGQLYNERSQHKVVYMPICCM